MGLDAKRSFTCYAKKRIEYIHRLSSEYNGKSREHMHTLLRFVEEHDMEIHELYKKNDDHFSTEVGDLMILCMEILLEESQDLDVILDNCYRRYEKKLKSLMSDS